MNFKHGYRCTPEYTAWCRIKAVCCNKNNPKFTNYGGRGIKICDRWLESFENFLSDMGHRPSEKHSIDRINNDGNYEPDNCRWTTSTNQANNRRSNVLFLVDNTSMSVQEYADLHGISYKLAHQRLTRDGLGIKQSCS